MTRESCSVIYIHYAQCAMICARRLGLGSSLIFAKPNSESRYPGRTGCSNRRVDIAGEGWHHELRFLRIPLLLAIVVTQAQRTSSVPLRVSLRLGGVVCPTSRREPKKTKKRGGGAALQVDGTTQTALARDLPLRPGSLAAGPPGSHQLEWGSAASKEVPGVPSHCHQSTLSPGRGIYFSSGAGTPHFTIRWITRAFEPEPTPSTQA